MASRRDEAPLTRHRKKEEEQNARDAKRRKTLFLPQKVIGPNDIAVNLAEGKIKLEVKDIKQEVEEAVAEDSGSGSSDQLIDGQILEGNSMEETEHSVLVIKQELDDHSNEGSESDQLTEDLSVTTESMTVSSQSIQEEIRLSRLEIAEKNARIQVLEQNAKEDKAKITALEEKISQLEKTNALIAKDNKVICLFPQVAQIIWKKYRFSYFRRQDFLGARLVHSAWKKAIDEIDQGPCQPLQDKCSVLVDINNSKDVKEKLPLLQTRLSSEAYPKVSRLCLKFEMEAHSSPWQHWDKRVCKNVILALLKANGPNIISFENSIDCYGNTAMFQDTLDWFRTLIDWLVLMPNLKELIITHPNMEIPNVPSLLLFNYMEQQVMLTFDRLERISFVTVPKPVILAILGKSNRLIGLHLELSHKSLARACMRGVPDKSNLCPQLKHVSMKFVDSKCFDILLQLGLNLVSLETLKLTWGKEVTFAHHLLCQILRQLTSLVDVQLVGNLYIGTEDLAAFPSPLRNMLDLEQLEVGVPAEQPYNARQYKDINENVVSNLWRVLPKLETVTIFACHADDPSKPVDRLTFKYTRSMHRPGKFVQQTPTPEVITKPKPNNKVIKLPQGLPPGSRYTWSLGGITMELFRNADGHLTHVVHRPPHT